MLFLVSNILEQHFARKFGFNIGTTYFTIITHVVGSNKIKIQNNVLIYDSKK